MHAERDYLVKSVFPALSEWCEARKLRLIDIDLRWGVTAADSEAKNTVRACLRNIDECRPFFLCFMGQRRGWIPNPDDIGEDTYNLFPNLKRKRYAGEMSVTEMEILHALIDPLHNGVLRGTKDDSRSGKAVKHAFFYLREPSYLDNLPHSDLQYIYTNEAEKDKLTADKELTRWRDKKIPRTGRPIHKYSARWQMNESTPEIALSLCVPTTSPKDSDAWQQAFKAWKKRWEAVGVKVDESGEITGAELVKANSYNKAFTHGRLGGFETSGRPLSELIIEELKDAISKRFPEHMTISELSPLQKELDQQAQFLRIAGDGFIERAGDFDALYEYINGGEMRPFALTAFAGMGKTSLLAHFIETYTAKSGETLHYRFIGGSDDSVSTERLIRSLLDELKSVGKIKMDIPTDYEVLAELLEKYKDFSEIEKIDADIPTNSIDMMNMLPKFLEKAGKIGKTVIVIDALNQLESGMDDLYWIPGTLPANVKLIISFKRGDENAERYYRKQEEPGGMILAAVKPFNSEDDRKAIVVAYLEQYFKELDEPCIKSLINSDGAENPLFLKIALSELRVFGVHNDLTEVIKNRFGTKPLTAFEAVLDRMESDAAYTKLTPAIMIPHMFGWLSYSRYGLSVDELAEISVRENLTDNKADALDAIYLILRQLRPFLAKRDGRIDFLYNSFKLAAAWRYESKHPHARTTEDWHKSLAEYFETLPLSNRHKLMEQAWQYAEARMKKEYINFLYDYCFIDARLHEFGFADLISDYTHLLVSDREHSVARHLMECLMLSGHIIAFDPSQLASQLWGRMADSEDDRVKKLLKQAVDVKKERKEVWIRPKKACFEKPGGALIRILQTSTGGFAVTPDGNSIAYTDKRTEKLTLKDIKTGKVLKTFDVHMRHISIHENGRFAAFIDSNDRVGLCDFLTGGVDFSEDKVRNSGVDAFIFSTKTIVVRRSHGYLDRTQIWNAVTLKRTHDILDDGYGSEHSVKLFANGTKLVTGYEHNRIRIWDTATGMGLKDLEGHNYPLEAFFVDEYSDRLYSFSSTKLIAYCISSGELIYSKPVDSPYCYAMSPNGEYLVCGRNNISVIWAHSGWEQYTIQSKCSGVSHYSFSYYGNVLIEAGGCDIWLWDMKNREYLDRHSRHNKRVCKVSVTRGEDYLISSSSDGMIKIWWYRELLDTSLYQTPTSTINCLEMLNDTQIITVGASNDIKEYDIITTQACLSNRIKKESESENIDAMLIDVDTVSDRILICDDDRAEIRALKNGGLVSSFQIVSPKEKEEISCYSYNAMLFDNGKKVIKVKNNRAYIYDAKTGEILNSIRLYYKDLSDWLIIHDPKKLIFIEKYAKPSGNIVQFYSMEGVFQGSMLFPDKSVLFTALSELSPTAFYDLRQDYGLFVPDHMNYVLKTSSDLTLINEKTGETVTSFQNDLLFGDVVCTRGCEHIACSVGGELAFLQLENMVWDDTKPIVPKPTLKKKLIKLKKRLKRNLQEFFNNYVVVLVPIKIRVWWRVRRYYR
jgi:WD40 repeat protein